MLKGLTVTKKESSAEPLAPQPPQALPLTVCAECSQLAALCRASLTVAVPVQSSESEAFCSAACRYCHGFLGVEGLPAHLPCRCVAYGAGREGFERCEGLGFEGVALEGPR